MKLTFALLVAAAGLLEYTNAQTYKGCFSDNGGATLVNNTNIFNSRGDCQKKCMAANKPVELVSNRIECWCGDLYPAASTKVDDSKCNSPCVGYDLETCGGIGYYSVLLDGLTTSAEEAEAPVNPSKSSSSSSAKGSSTATPIAGASPSVVTPPTQTVMVTATPKTSAAPETKKSGPNVAAIAAGVVVGFVGIAAIALGIFLFMRHKRRREIEDEHRRTAAVNSFIGGSQKAPTTSAGSSFTDTRLDPVVMAGRRMSDGSIADNQDYSRRILKVTNA